MYSPVVISLSLQALLSTLPGLAHPAGCAPTMWNSLHFPTPARPVVSSLTQDLLYNLLDLVQNENAELFVKKLFRISGWQQQTLSQYGALLSRAPLDYPVCTHMRLAGTRSFCSSFSELLFASS